MLAILTLVFFFQMLVTRSERFVFWFRIAFLTATLFFLGWYANAQLSIVNLMALASSLQAGFSWQAFLLDPLTFILWFSVAAALIFWGRGAYCGWLCPFGALQELTNRIAKFFRVPQWTVPWALHERLWAVKYIIFLGLFGVTLASLDQAERFAEVEPFKTAIVLKFDRAWPFVAYALVLLGIGLFVERFFCRYLCPLGAALAIPARMRMFDWLKRYRDCGHPCQTCAGNAWSRRSTRRARSTPTSATTACTARCSTRARPAARWSSAGSSGARRSPPATRLPPRPSAVR